MKVKEIDVTANVAWSPASASPIYLAAGTAAQQLDATFSTNSALEIYDISLSEDGQSMKKVASIPTENRFHKIVWGNSGIVNPVTNRPSGLIVGGLDRGFISVYDASKLLEDNGENALVLNRDKHTGQVSALDFNPFQHSLLASGASDSEIFIWDMNKPSSPMSPGAKSLPAEDVRSIAWNRQVQHILATTFSSRCVVWDLRKNDPIIKIANQGSMRCGSVAWHPEVATQMCIASEDDKSPVIQIWDLRLASSPLRVLERHTRGVLGVSWCERDSDLLLSCGKDNQIYCWNPNSNVPGGEVVGEISSSNDGCWSFDISWCPRNPAIIATSSFDGKVSVYSLLGGQQQNQPTKTSAAIADSFPGMETMQPLSQPVPSNTSSVSTANQLKIPPKWLKKPCGARFGFGGKLVTFDFDSNNTQTENPSAQANQQSQTTLQKRSSVFVSKVVTEPDLVQKSLQLETSLNNENLSEFCNLKIAESTTKDDQQIWKFIRANFSDNPNNEFLELLGYNPEQICSQISSVAGTLPANALRLHGEQLPNSIEPSMDELTNEMEGLGNSVTNEDAKDAIFNQIAEQAHEDEAHRKPFVICTENNGPGMLSKALLTKNLEIAVDLCLKQNRFADALILAMQGGAELFQQTQQKYFSKCATEENCELPLIEAVVNCDWSNVIERCDVGQNWQESLVAALTYCAGNPQDGTVTSPAFEKLCSRLGSRLMELGTSEAKHHALICFVCAGNLENVVQCWVDTRESDTKEKQTSNVKALQDLVEVVMLLKKAIYRLGKGGYVDNTTNIADGALSKNLTEYAAYLASQGALEAAITYLGDTKDENESVLISELRDRVQGALGVKSTIRKRSNKTHTQQNSSKAGGWTQPANTSAPTYQGSYQNAFHAPYSSGIHNPVYEDLNTFNTPVPHSDAHGITTRRNSRPRNPSVEAYPPPSNAFQGQGTYAPPPSFQADVPSGGYHSQQNVGSFNQPDSNIPSQPPVNIFTPDFSKQGTHVPPMSNVLRHENQNNAKNSVISSAPGPIPISSGSGWNDPPPMQAIISKPKASTIPAPSPIQAPITQPLMQMPGLEPVRDTFSGSAGLPPPPINNPYSSHGANIPSHPPTTNASFSQPPQGGTFGGYQSTNQFSQQTQPSMFNPIQQPMNIMAPHAPISVTQPNFMNQNQGEENRFSPLPNQPPTHERIQTRPKLVEEPKPKEPIPTEHQILHDVFEGLKTRCLAVASHPQTKRKLEDVGKKLEILYDKLRENSLPKSTIDGLHQIKDGIWAYDYNSCLSYVNQLVSTGSFSVLSQFLPGIKVLLQVSSQLGVFLEKSL